MQCKKTKQTKPQQQQNRNRPNVCTCCFVPRDYVHAASVSFFLYYIYLPCCAINTSLVRVSPEYKSQDLLS